MRISSAVFLLILFLNNCIQLQMPPVDTYIAALLSLVKIKNTAAGSTNLPPTLSYSNTPYTFDQNSTITTITPTITGTITSCISLPDLPAGLVLDTTTCSISGMPTSALTATGFTITASNAYESSSASITITINLVPPTALTYSGNSFLMALNVAAPTITPTVTGTVTNCTSSPILPAGLTLNATTCTITGQPGAVQSATNHSITASNAAGSTTATISITVTSLALHYAINSTLGDTTATVTDQTGNGRNGTLINSPAFSTDFTAAANQSYQFNGSNQYITFSDTGLPMGASARTICAWYKATSVPTGYGIIVGYGSSALGQGSGLGIFQNNTLTFFGFGGGVYDLDFSYSIVLNTWTHLCGTYDGTTAKIYVNGVLKTSAAKSWNTVTGTGGCVGAQIGATPTAYFPGSIDDVRIYGTALTAAEIASLIPPFNLNYAGTPYKFTKGTTIATLTPTVSGVPTSYSVTPALPAGLTINPSTGQLSGAPTSFGSASGWKVAQNYTITAANSAGSTTAAITITVMEFALYYAMNSSLGDTTSVVYDQSGYGANGTVVNISAFSTDRTGAGNQSYQFNGVNSYILFSAVNLPKGNTPRTMCIWERPGVAPNGLTLIDYGGMVVSQAFGLAVWNGFYRFYGWGNDMNTAGPTPAGVWTHVCGRYDGSTATIFINGSPIGSSVRGWNTQGNTGLIGRNLDGNAAINYNGSIDEVRVYGYALTDSEILALYGL